MTFTEAAAHVLRLVGKPLHYKEITDVAIEKDLLSHVGKSPEVTMGARLAAVVKKDQKDSPLIRVKPGVFALRDWDQAMIDAGLSDRTPALERLANLEAKGEAPRIDEIVEDVGASVVDELEDEVELEEGEEEEEDIGEDERVRAELAAAGVDRAGHVRHRDRLASRDLRRVLGDATSAEPRLPAAAAYQTCFP